MRARAQITQATYPLKICGFGVGNYTRLHGRDRSRKSDSFWFSRLACLSAVLVLSSMGGWLLTFHLLSPWRVVFSARRAIASPGSLHDLA